jgi:hypothetical protein
MNNYKAIVIEAPVVQASLLDTPYEYVDIGFFNYGHVELGRKDGTALVQVFVDASSDKQSVSQSKISSYGVTVPEMAE